MSTVDAPHLPLSGRFSELASDIKVSHTVFALPWALLAMFMAADGWPRAGQVALILICMVTARTAAMASNRLLDVNFDALNPRTRNRALPAGRLTRSFYAVVLLASAMGFMAACLGFGLLYNNWIPTIAAIPVLLFLCSYPFLKRFTWGCHFYLGAALGLAPVCAWAAIAGNVAWPPVVMGVAVLCWTAGFDIIYACQDVAVDRATGLHSIPARLGVSGALWVSRWTHVACVALLVGLGWGSEQLGMLYFAGLAAAVGLLIAQHRVVKPDDLSRVNLAFFTLNGVISVLMGLSGIASVFFRA
jgi:4-hydroxybenzoate polyprenyltransferase